MTKVVIVKGESSLHVPQWICNKAAQCKSTNYDICMHHHPHEKNHLCGPDTEKDPAMPCYKTECNPILVDWDK